jgi:hypothetical protein
MTVTPDELMKKSCGVHSLVAGHFLTSFTSPNWLRAHPTSSSMDNNLLLQG